MKHLNALLLYHIEGNYLEINIFNVTFNFKVKLLFTLERGQIFSSTILLKDLKSIYFIVKILNKDRYFNSNYKMKANSWTVVLCWQDNC